MCGLTSKVASTLARDGTCDGAVGDRRIRCDCLLVHSLDAFRAQHVRIQPDKRRQIRRVARDQRFEEIDGDRIARGVLNRVKRLRQASRVVATALQASDVSHAVVVHQDRIETFNDGVPTGELGTASACQRRLGGRQRRVTARGARANDVQVRIELRDDGSRGGAEDGKERGEGQAAAQVTDDEAGGGRGA